MYRLIQPLVTAYRTRAFTLALLLTFLVRALIPIGYMPDAKQDGIHGFALSLCSSGLSAATVSALDLDTDAPQTEHYLSYCAFGSALGSFAPPTNTYVFFVSALLADFVLPRLRDSAVSSWQVQGPPLGPRAPPVYRSILFSA